LVFIPNRLVRNRRFNAVVERFLITDDVNGFTLAIGGAAVEDKNDVHDGYPLLWRPGVVFGDKAPGRLFTERLAAGPLDTAISSE
jgi:hypothetical protein